MRWVKFWQRGRKNRELTQELESYLAQETDDNIAAGMEPDAARGAALRRLGNVTRVRETVYEDHSILVLEHLWRDVRFGLRQLRRTPAFTAAAVLSLALGVGANTSIFALVNALSLRPLPVVHPQDLVEVRLLGEGRSGRQSGRNRQFSLAQWAELQKRQQAFSSLLAFADTRFNLSPTGQVRYVEGLWVSGSFFDTLGIHPVVGRLFTVSDDPPTPPPGCGYRGAVISYPFWQREYGGRPDVTAQHLDINGNRVPIVGVTPPGFFGLEVGRQFEVALPVCNSGFGGQEHWWLAAVGRLKPGWTRSQAESQLQAMLPDMQRAAISPTHPALYAEKYLNMRASVVDAGTGVSPLRRDYQQPLSILLVIAALMFLIATVNLANLMLARATTRQQEFALRLAIGGSRRRVLQQVFTESVLLSIIASAAAIVVASLATASIVALISTPVDRIFLDLRLDWRVLMFTAAIATLASLIFGLIPAFKVVRGTTLRTDARTTTGSRDRLQLRRVLIVAQVSITLVLLFGSLLFLRSFRNLTNTDAGLRADGVLVANLFFRDSDYPVAKRPSAYAAIEDRLRALPGVTGVASAFTSPLGGNFWETDIKVGGNVVGSSNLNEVSADYFDVVGGTLLAGRAFDARDTPASPPVAIVSETFATRYLNGQPLGRSIAVASGGNRDNPLTVVGVVKDQKYYSMREPFFPLIFLARSQVREPGLTQRLMLHTIAPTEDLLPVVARALADIDSNISVRFATIREQIDGTMLRERLLARLSALFGGMALVLAVVGLYGVVAYTVARRRTEIGIRVALGAARTRILAMMIGDIARTMSIGLAIGTLAAISVAGAARTLLYQIEPRDAATLGLAALVLSGAGLIAAAIPARRAATVDPIQALRE